MNKWRYSAAKILKLQITTLREPMNKWSYSAAGILKLQGLLLLQGKSHGDYYCKGKVSTSTLVYILEDKDVLKEEVYVLKEEVLL